MRDMIPKGTGNSRFLRSSIAADITHEELVALLRSGKFPVDFAGLNEDGINVLGSAYNKANVLPDTVCNSLGIPTTSEPKDAFFNLFERGSYNKFRLVEKVTASKVWICPNDISQITAILVGAGAGATEYLETGVYPGSASGCSGTSFLVPRIKVTPGESYEIVIGAGGGAGKNPGGHTSAFGFTALGAPACFSDSGMEVTGSINNRSTSFGGSSPGEFNVNSTNTMYLNIRGGGERTYRAGGAYDKSINSINSFLTSGQFPAYIPDGAIPWFTELMGNTLLASGGRCTGEPAAPNTGNGGNGATKEKPNSNQPGSSGVVYIYA